MKRQFLASVMGATVGAFLFVGTGAASAQTVTKAGGSPPRAVVVRAGDSLSAIAARTGSTWPALAYVNHVANPNLIFPGQRFVIPPPGYRPPAFYLGGLMARPDPVPVRVYQAPAPQRTYQAPVVYRQTYTAPVQHYQAPAPVSVSGSGLWGCIAAHESGGNPGTNTGNGYYGAFQDTIGSWQSAGGGPGLPSSYSYAEQLAVNERIQAQQGWGAWPNTSRMCGA